MLAALASASRPHQWVKNLFVAAPLVFAVRIGDATAVARTAAAVLCFCVLSSAVYLLNDVVDVDKDRIHPLKRHRAVASGALSIRNAKIAAAVFAASALGGAALLGGAFCAVSAGYLTLNLAYSLALKRIAFLDVGCISVGFLLRVLGGATAIPVDPSPWLMICTLLLAAFLGFGKRAHELRVAGARGGSQREALGGYSPHALRWLLIVLALLTVVAYAAYTQSGHAQGFFHTRNLALTVPFVAFGIGRFIWLASRNVDDESPTDSMLRDRPFLVNLVAYATAIVVIIYRAQ